MDDDYGDYLYEKRKDAKLDRMHDLMAENQRLREAIIKHKNSFDSESQPYAHEDQELWDVLRKR
jgi:hypothetical protein